MEAGASSTPALCKHLNVVPGCTDNCSASAGSGAEPVQCSAVWGRRYLSSAIMVTSQSQSKGTFSITRTCGIILFLYIDYFFRPLTRLSLNHLLHLPLLLSQRTHDRTADDFLLSQPCIQIQMIGLFLSRTFIYFHKFT